MGVSDQTMDTIVLLLSCEYDLSLADIICIIKLTAESEMH